LKSTIIILLVFIIILQSLLKSFILFDYYINKNFYAKEICIKKNIANNTCQGKCHLATEIKNVNKEEKKQSNNIFQKLEILLFIEEIKESKILIYKREKQLFSYINLYKNIKTLNIFHPPKF